MNFLWGPNLGSLVLGTVASGEGSDRSLSHSGMDGVYSVLRSSLVLPTEEHFGLHYPQCGLVHIFAISCSTGCLSLHVST